MRWGVVLNRGSGTAPDRATLEAALAQAGIAADILPAPGERGGERIDHAAGYDVLVAAGGDGTVSTVAAVAARHGTTMGVIPGGTLNHFARDTGIPLDLGGAVSVLAAGYTRLLDVGAVNDHIFINNASIGAYPRMVWERNQARRKGMPRPIAVSIAVARTWFDLRSIPVRLTADDTDMIRRSPFIFVGNSKYEVEGTSIGRRTTMTDGKLSLYLAPKFGRIDALLLPVRVLLRTLERHEKFEARTASAITIEPPGPRVVVALDGEIRTLDAPLRFTVHRGVLRAILPASSSG